jgi:phytoene desaturase
MSTSDSPIPTDRPSGIRLKDGHSGKQQDEIIIIGAGPGGLASAMLLAQAGLPVRIIERESHVGGRTSAFGADGFKFDLGPTFFLYPAILESIFKAVGRNLHDEVEMVRVDPQYRIHFGTTDVDILCTPDMEEMQRRIAEIAPEDAANLPRYIQDNRDKLEAMKPILQSGTEGWKDWLSVAKLLAVLRPWSSLDDELKRYFKDARVRRAFSFQSKYLGMSPYNCPSMFSILSFLEYETGVHHPIGGCAAVTEAMARVCWEMGVQFSMNEPVEEILFEGKKAVGVRTNKKTYRCESLVINADFANTMTKLVPNHLRKKWSDEKLAKKKYSCSTYMMYLGIEGQYDNLAHHTVFIPDDYDKNLEEIENQSVLSEDPSFYVQNACVNDPTLAPKGMSTLYILVPVTNQCEKIDWNVEKHAFRTRVIKQLEKIGITGLEERIRYERVITPADWVSRYELYTGAVFNLAHNLGQLLSFRPNNRFEELDSVYLVGGGTHPGSGLPVIFESARITSRLLLEDRGDETAFIDETAAPVSIDKPLTIRRVA